MPAPSWAPAANDVAGLIAQRTVDATGIPTGQFTASTVPTDTQVDSLIEDVAGEVTATCGTIPDTLTDDAQLVVRIGVAALIESSFDEGSNQALATLYTNRYLAALTRLQTACAQVAESGQVEPLGSPPAALFSFPDISGGDPYVDATTKYTQW